MDNEKEKVFQWLTELGNEMEYLASSPLQAKYKVMLLMVYIDIFSQVWDIVQGSGTKTQKDRFEKWTNKFFFAVSSDADRNELGQLAPLDALKLYQIRNSLLHFGGLPAIGIPVFITVYNKQRFLEKHADKIEVFGNDNAGFNADTDMLLLYPNLLYSRMVNAVINTVKELAIMFRENSSMEQNMLRALYQKLSENHAMPVFDS